MPFSKGFQAAVDIRLRVWRSIGNRGRRLPGQGAEDRAHTIGKAARIIAALQHKYDFSTTEFIGQRNEFL